MKHEEFEKRAISTAAVLICAFLGLLAVYLLIRYGLPVLLPFIIGWSVALMIVPLAVMLAGKRGKKSRIISVIILILLISLVVLLLVLAFNRLIYESERLLGRLGDESEKIFEIISRALDFAQSLSENIPFLDRLGSSEEMEGLRERIDGLVGEILTGFVTRLSTSIPIWLGNIISAFPSFMLFLLVTLISSFYFCIDLDKIHLSLRKALPVAISSGLGDIRQKLKGTVLRYLRAYILLLMMTFAELFVGFTLLGIDYALLLAAVIALIDILPVFGVGSVLIPWSGILLLSGSYYRGIGLLIVYACITVARQISEPKIVGGSIGLHPLLTLVSMYAGFKLFGFFGMIFGPITAVILKGIFFSEEKAVIPQIDNSKNEKVKK